MVSFFSHAWSSYFRTGLPPVYEVSSSDGVWRLVSRPIYASLDFEGFRSQCLKTLNTRKITLCEASVIQPIFDRSAVSADKEISKQGKQAKSSKMFQLWGADPFFNFQPKFTNFQVSISDFLMKSRSRSLNQVSVLENYCFDYITVLQISRFAATVSRWYRAGAQPGGRGHLPPEIFKTLHSNFDIRNVQRIKMKLYILIIFKKSYWKFSLCYW